MADANRGTIYFSLLPYYQLHSNGSLTKTPEPHSHQPKRFPQHEAISSKLSPDSIRRKEAHVRPSTHANGYSATESHYEGPMSAAKQWEITKGGGLQATDMIKVDLRTKLICSLHLSRTEGGWGVRLPCHVPLYVTRMVGISFAST